jgi:hypothetical protein
MLPVVLDNSPVLDGPIHFRHDGTNFLIENNKLYKEDTREVAVVYSPGFGGGWSTWNEYVDPADARVAVALIAQVGKLTVEPYRLFLSADDEFHGNVVIHRTQGFTSAFSFDEHPYHGNDLAILWTPEGTQYDITEYDGAESVEYIGHKVYRTA